MKKLLVSCCLLSVLAGAAQTKVDKSIPVKAGQKLLLSFDYPEVKLQTWDKQEVKIEGTVSINQGENDNAFEIQNAESGGIVSVTTLLKDKENIPHRIVIRKGETEYFFKAKDINDPQVQKFLEQNGKDYEYISSGIVRDIRLTIYVPSKMETKVESKYGMVEVKSFDAPLVVDSKYGGVDLTVAAASVGDITARTRHGEILTNLDVKFDQAPFSKRESWTEIHARPGTGPAFMLESKYGNVYLRKP